MNRESLQIICCPICKSDLFLNDAERATIQRGRLVCRKCLNGYQIQDGIPRLLPQEQIPGMSRRSERLYDFSAPLYDIGAKLFFTHCGGEKKAREEYLKRLDLRGDSSVLEVSVGTGANLPFIKDCVSEGKIYGLDISMGQLKQCLKNAKKWGIEPELFNGAAEELPFRDSSFDVVFHMGGINLFTDKKKAIDEMIRVAKPGTKIVIVDETLSPEPLPHRLLLGLFPFLKTNTGPPIDLVSQDMRDIKCDYIWKGHGYLIEFTKPYH